MSCHPTPKSVEPTDRPFTFRVKRFFSQWVDDRHVCAILHEGIYRECRGPLFFSYNYFSERMGPIIYIGYRFGNYTFDNFSSCDPMKIGLTVGASFTFDPRKTAIAGVLVGLTDDVFCSLVKGEIARWLRPQIAQYTAQEIRQSLGFNRIETDVLALLQGNPDLPQLGINVSKVELQDPLLPTEIEDGFVQAARRRLDIAAVQGWQDPEFARHLAVIIAEKSSGEQYLNAADIFTALRQTRTPAALQPPTIEVINQAPTPPTEPPRPYTSSQSYSGPPPLEPRPEPKPVAKHGSSDNDGGNYISN